MSMNDTLVGSVTSSIFTAGGQKITQMIDPEPSIFTRAAFSCSADKLTITVDSYQAVVHREH